MKKKLFSLLLVLILVFVSVEDVHADAGSLVIAGGSVAGVTAGVIAGPAVVAVFCAMMAFGMNVELTRASEEAGMTKTQFLKNKIEQYCNEAQISANTFNNYILDQANVFQNGAISITDKAGQLIERFCNWLFDSESVSDETTGIASSVVINGLTCPVIQAGQSYTVYNVNGGEAIVIYNNGLKPLALMMYGYNHGAYGYIRELVGLTGDVSTFDNFSLSFRSRYNNDDYSTYTFSNNGIYCLTIAGVASNGNITNYQVPFYDEYCGNSSQDTFQHFLGNTSSIDFGSSVGEDTITGSMDDYDLSKHVLNPTDDKTIVINPNISITVPDDKDITIDVNEYLDVIQDLIDGLKDDIITAIDDATGVPITIEFDPTQDWDPTIEQEEDTDLPVDDDKTPIVPDDRIPIDYDLDPLKFDLKGVFPFCIPWDIRDMLSKLSADPVAPSYTVNWLVPIVNERLIFTVDLSPFDNVASILRKMEILSFCIGLAMITRQIYLRG